MQLVTVKNKQVEVIKNAGATAPEVWEIGQRWAEENKLNSWYVFDENVIIEPIDKKPFFKSTKILGNPEIQKMIEESKTATCAEIAEKRGISESKVYHILYKKGVKAVRQVRQVRENTAKEKIIKRIKEIGFPLPRGIQGQLAKEFSVTRQMVSLVMLSEGNKGISKGNVSP